jgi:hypothetical protein
MNRIKDYGVFIGWFAGLGYIVLWPLTASEMGGRSAGASIVCRDSSLSALDLLCNSSPSVHLPPGLHALGFLSALFVMIRLVLYALRRSRRAVGRNEPAATSVDIQRLKIIVPPPQRKPRPPLPPVKPRSHFGLRGVPH